MLAKRLLLGVGFAPFQPFSVRMAPPRPSSATCAMDAPPSPKIVSSTFYSLYNGHPLPDLETLATNLPTPRIWLAGDSTLDNKYWLPPASHTPPASYAPLLSPQLARRDIAYWLTHLAPPTHPFPAINCAVEESTLRARRSRLLAHDALLAKRLAPDDVLVVCIGANDVALGPSLALAFAVLANVYLGERFGRRTLRRLFVKGAERYIARLTENTRPRLVLVCTLYYLDISRSPSWAGMVLRMLSYNSRPGLLQAAIRRVFQYTHEITVDGTKVVPVPLFEALDGNDSGDYVARVEPSEQGGRKVAELILKVMQRELPSEEGK